ncbi:MAG: phosphoribosyltransferase [Balneolaceae bacterium]|nr:phosphoribosyltransferase [Balneolaceae bacterium]
MKKDFTARIVGLPEVYEMAYVISQKVTESNLKFDVIVGIARGGFPPARFVCDFLNIKTLTSVQIRHYTGGAKEKKDIEITDAVGIDLQDKNVLIVDDVNDSGKTLTAAVNHIKAKGASEFKTAVLHEKDNTSLKADFVGGYLDDWKWLIYQWAATEDLVEFLQGDDMLTAGQQEIRSHLEDTYELEVSGELIEKVMAMKGNYLR